MFLMATLDRLSAVTNGGFVELNFAESGVHGTTAVEKADRLQRAQMVSWPFREVAAR